MVVRLSISVLVVVFVGIALISAGRAFITESNDTLNTISSLEEDKELRPNTAKDGNTLSFPPQHKTRSQNYQSKGFRPSKSISSSSRGQNSHPESSRHFEFTHQKREKQRASEGHRSSSPGQPSQKGHQSWIGNITCDACKVLVGSIQKLMTEQKTTDDIIKAAIEICKLYKIESSRVCDLIVPQYSEMFLGVVRWTVLNPNEICGYALGDSCAVPYDPVGLWNVTISDKPKPPLTPRVLPKPGSPTLRVLHLTDIHLDVEYRPGADADCGEPLCCRAYDLDPAPTRSSQAGRWGDYRNCDMPADTLELLFQHLSAIQDQFDYVIFTGDIAAHDVWNQTRSDQLTNLLRLTKLFRTYLPDKPVFPCPGNHEGVPCDSFPPDTVKGQSMEWLYSAYLEAWGYWLPASVAQAIMRGGFYTFSPFPGFRIISLNANYGASSNWWLLLNATDPQGQLQWLADVLQESEDKEEKVHILSHFPPGHQLKGFAWNYYRLINRYESTVVGQFHGHTHKDEYEVFYDLHNTSRALGVSYVGGSVTLYSYTNPGYRIYTIDGNYTDSSWEILDYSHYYLDIARANTAGKATPTWSKEYSVKETYKMPSLFPEDWNNLIYRMKANDTLFQQYYTELDAEVFGNEVYASNCHSSVSTVPSLSLAGRDDRTETGRPPPSLQALTVEREVSNDDDDFGGSDDEIGDEESTGAVRRTKGTKRSRVTINQQAILLHAPVFEQTKKSMWDAQRSMRYNQDAQRQEDQRRIKEVRMYLTKLRLNPEKVERPKKEFAGGTFSKLEAQWRATQAPVVGKQSGPPQFRAKPKPPMSVRSNNMP